ncbi:MAG: ATP-binding cassette domain-containing protein [Proteobacteria bacterium]|nr:ATP-binding cassette domain-containing protein [Pseudomonadota bacterium]
MRLQNVLYRFNADAPVVLDVPAWEVPRREKIFLQGESGSGKSTLLALLAGLQTPSSGEVTILGTAMSALSSRKRDRFRAQNLGVVFQQFNLIPYLSVLDNVLLAAKFGETAAAATKQRAIELLQRVNLPCDLHQRKAAQLSIGQQQRVAIVRALINSPSLLLVDEPTSALDHANRDAFLTLLFDVLAERDCAMVFVSHDPAIGQYFHSKVRVSDINRAETVG